MIIILFKDKLYKFYGWLMFQQGQIKHCFGLVQVYFDSKVGPCDSVEVGQGIMFTYIDINRWAFSDVYQ